MKGNPYSDQDVAVMARMFREGASDADISVELKRTQASIATKRHALGLVRHHRGRNHVSPRILQNDDLPMQLEAPVTVGSDRLLAALRKHHG